MPRKKKDEPPVNNLLPPSPFHLALLAALLGQRDGELRPDIKMGRNRWTHYKQNYEERHFYTRDAMVKAARFYMLACGWHSEFSRLSEENLHTFLIGSMERGNSLHQALKGGTWVAYEHMTAYTLYRDGIRLSEEIREKEFQYGLDPVRNYLQKHASFLNWQKTSTVTSAIRKFFQDFAEQHNATEAATIEDFRKRAISIAKQLGMSVSELLAWRFPKDSRRPLAGSELFRHFTNDTAIIGGEQNVPDSPKLHGETIGWKLTSDFLEVFVRWRIAMKKRPGGLMSIGD